VQPQAVETTIKQMIEYRKPQKKEIPDSELTEETKYN